MKIFGMGIYELIFVLVIPLAIAITCAVISRN